MMFNCHAGVVFPLTQDGGNDIGQFKLLTCVFQALDFIYNCKSKRQSRDTLAERATMLHEIHIRLFHAATPSFFVGRSEPGYPHAEWIVPTEFIGVSPKMDYESYGLGQMA